MNMGPIGKWLSTNWRLLVLACEMFMTILNFIAMIISIEWTRICLMMTYEQIADLKDHGVDVTVQGFNQNDLPQNNDVIKLWNAKVLNERHFDYYLCFGLHSFLAAISCGLAVNGLIKRSKKTLLASFVCTMAVLILLPIYLMYIYFTTDKYKTLPLIIRNDGINCKWFRSEKEHSAFSFINSYLMFSIPAFLYATFFALGKIGVYEFYCDLCRKFNCKQCQQNQIKNDENKENPNQHVITNNNCQHETKSSTTGFINPLRFILIAVKSMLVKIEATKPTAV